MPQMAPMLWLVLFVYFVALFILYIINFYFISLPAALTHSKAGSSQVSKFSWSW